jgi:hypothetical protein
MITKLDPAPLAYPNGGGLKAMGTKPRESQRLEVEALEAKHKAEIARLKEKHSKENKPVTSKAVK